MSKLFDVSVESRELIDGLTRLAQSADFVCTEVGRETADRIVTEAKGRVSRASGDTQAGIHWELGDDGRSYWVFGYTKGPHPPVDYFLEWGTKFMTAREFFYPSVTLEEGPHMRRLEDRVQSWLDEVGR